MDFIGLLFLYRTYITYIASGHLELPTINSYFQFKFNFDINKDKQIKNIIILPMSLNISGANALVSLVTTVRVFVLLLNSSTLGIKGAY